MQNKIKDLFNNNQELIKIAAIGLSMASVVILVILSFALTNQKKKMDAESFPDEAATENNIIVSDIDKLLDYGLDLTTYADAKKHINTFLATILSDVNRVYFIDSSVNKTENEYSFNMISDDDKKFEVRLSGKEKTNYILSIFYLGQEILNYASATIKVPPKNFATIDAILPYGIETGSGAEIMIDKVPSNEDNQYLIYIDSCNGKPDMQEIINKVSEELHMLGYDYQDFNFKILDYPEEYCDY